MHMTDRITSIRIAAIGIFAVGTTLGLYAQQQPEISLGKPIGLGAKLNAPIDLTRPMDLTYNSSIGVAETETAENYLSDPEGQPPPRRSYGHRPDYGDNTHNPDGSNKWTFQAGAGFTLPVGGTHGYYTTSWALQGGVGRNFNKNFGVMLDFNWANFGIQTNVLNNLLAIYNSLGAVDQNGNPLSQLGGYGHVWSFSIDPVYNMLQGDTSGLYVTGGAGFYHKYSAFTIPGVGIYCDPFFGCYQVAANQRIDWYTSNAIGFNVGFGYTYRFSKFSGGRLFVETKYVYTANSRRPYFDGTGTNPVPSNPNYFNVFPQGSTPTSFIPITFGIRF